jgi:zinc transporter
MPEIAKGEPSPSNTPAVDPDGLVAAWMMDGRGGGRIIGWDEIRGWTPDEGLVWVHLDLTAKGARRWLRREGGLEHHMAEALLAEETRPRALAAAGGLLVILRGVNTNPGEDPEDMVAIRIWIEGNRIISTRRRRLLSVQDMREDLTAGRGPTSPGDFLVRLADRMVFRMSDVIDELDAKVTELEEAVLAEESHALRARLADLRRKAILLRRYLSPQREALSRLAGERTDLLSDNDRLGLREVTDTVIRYVEELESAKERAAVAQEELASRLAEQMNQRMYVLSLVAGLFLPLGFLTGLLGINVGGIPGSDDPMAFLEVSLMLAALVAVQVVIFRWRKWF